LKDFCIAKFVHSTIKTTITMDLLGSIMGKMTGPPTATEKQKAERKKARELAQKLEEKQREESKIFRKKMEDKIGVFLGQDVADGRCLTFPPMTKYERSVVHDVAEVTGATVAHSFGQEDEDRHVVIWRKEDPPSDDEINCLKTGRAWDPDLIEREKQEKLKQDILDEKEEKERIKNDKKPFVPTKSNYRDKYQHLIGDAKDKIGQVNKSFGFVSAEEKKDRRTMEQIQADIRAKRKMAGSSASEPGSQEEGPSQPKMSKPS